MSELNKQYYQPLLQKTQTEYEQGFYDCFPAFDLKDETINQGYDILANHIIGNVPKGLRVLVIDGFLGVNWQTFRQNLSQVLSEKNITPDWLDINTCLNEESEIRNRVEPFMGGDDPVFGTHYPFGPEIFFDAKKIADYRIQASIARGEKAGNLTIFYGCGAGLLEIWDELWYLDFPKDLAQEHARQGKVSNFGETQTPPFEEFYKRVYFVEWTALNRLKRQLLPDIDIFIDAQNMESPASMNGKDFRSALHLLSQSPFRVRPWFYPGPWGGKFMQGHMDLDQEKPNFAWSFELIVPENGVVLEKEKVRLEFAFDFLMFQENNRVLGKTAANQFKYEWPIRLDYLDTVDGDNLSTQVHPRPNYIRKEFGETYTQDETYYIITSKPDSKVYLGLTETCDPEEFQNTLQNSIINGIEVDIEKFVNSEPSKPHDLFLIPNGTVHCSGAGNLVLEISATPYIFTFKIYDYMRRDLEGNLRPINIDRGFENIRFERRKKWVQDNLLAKPELVDEGADWKKYKYYDSPFTFYSIHRIDFKFEYEFDTDGDAYAVNLVEGESIKIIAQNNRTIELSYIESMIIPAAAGKIKLVNKGRHACKLILVCVKPGIGITQPLNIPQDG